MKSQGKAPLALRWERLKHRHQVHRECVQDLSDLLRRMDVDFRMIGREELDRQHLKNADLVVAVGGCVRLVFVPCRVVSCRESVVIDG